MSNMPAEKNRRVLVIDDNRAIHDDFRKILSPATTTTAALDATEGAVFGGARDAVRETRFEVDSAYQGQEGVSLAKRALEAGRPYAMAFVDVRMPPGWDGVETSRKLWAVDPDLQIVICTAYSDYSWGEMFAQLGARDGLLILKKPFDAVEAVQLAHALTEKWSLHRQARRKVEGLEGQVTERTRELRQTNQALQKEVAEHQRAEETLRRLRNQHTLILDSVSEGVQGLDLDGQITFENPASAAMLGYETPELIRRPAHGTTHHKRPDGAPYPERECPIHATLRDGQVRHVSDEVFWRKDGSSFPVEYTSTPLRGEEGGIIGATVVFSDITERKRLEAQVFQAQKLETVGNLAGGVAHEFNSLLTAIIGQSELLLKGLPLGNPLGNSATEIRHAAERAATLTRQLLAYGRKQLLQPEILELNSVLASMERPLRHLVGQGTDVRLAPGAGLKAVQADAGQLEQVVMNLALNAAEAMPAGGTLTLETANATLDRQYVNRFPEVRAGEYVMLAITDTGTGMSEEVKARVFEPFFTTKGVGQGTGLGLSTCYGIIKQSGGHIAVESAPGRGTTFKLYLPQVERPTKTPSQRLDSPDLPRGTETILLVEEDPALREMAAALLRRLGYTVLPAANALEALSLKPPRDLGPVDLWFTDVVMPEMSGRELAERARALYPRARILFTAAHTENALVHQGVMDQGVALLQRPFTPAALACKLRELLDQSSPARPDALPKTSGGSPAPLMG